MWKEKVQYTTTFVFLFFAVLLSLHLYYLYITYFWVASLEFPSQLESLIHWLLTSWSRQWWLKIKPSLTQLVFGQGWLYCPDFLEYEQCNQKIITNIAGWNSLSRWCWHSHFQGTWSEAFLHGSICNHAPAGRMWMELKTTVRSMVQTLSTSVKVRVDPHWMSLNKQWKERYLNARRKWRDSRLAALAINSKD